jgi:predicted DsbA family dithiol-disulfide isomerase
MNMTIDVTSDVICPWCYVGKRRLEKAIALAHCGDLRVRWHPFQLNPQMPKAGMSRREYRSAKFRSWERSLELDAQVTAVGRSEGIPFAFEKIERTPNTLDAHRLIWLADQEGVQNTVVEALFRAYFTEGADLTDLGTLLNVATGAGLDRSRAEGLLEGEEGLAAIRAAEDQSRRAGVQGVPFFTLNNKVVLSGAVETSAFLDAFKRAGGEKASANETRVCQVGPGGEPSC